MPTFITEFSGGSGIRIAVKDLIDMAGVPTTAGCRAVADRAQVAQTDALCLESIRHAERRGEVQIVGRTNLHELAFGVTGVNPWFGTPVNPADPALIPGGSSSGSAVALASGAADIAIGTDTGGSIRIPAACCAVAGLKTTYGRISCRGVWPLAPSLDTVGPMAATVDGLAAGMTLLEPGFQPADGIDGNSVARWRVQADPTIDDAIDRALRSAGFRLTDVELTGWASADKALLTIVCAEAWASYKYLVAEDSRGVSDEIANRVRSGRDLSPSDIASAEQIRRNWKRELASLFHRFPVLALPTLTADPTPLDSVNLMGARVATRPVNLAGLPALSLPIPRTGRRLPASLQLVGPPGSEEQLLATALAVEAAVK
ncbi:MAG: amidase [Acidimicrobiia bacterium]